MRFLDTLSLHVCVAGQTSAQKLLWRSARGKERNETDQKVSMYEEEYTGKSPPSLNCDTSAQKISYPLKKSCNNVPPNGN